jgi:hypothetical protein
VGVVVAMSNSAWRFGMGSDAAAKTSLAALGTSLAALQAAGGGLNPEWHRQLQRFVEEATRKAQQAMERARTLREEHEKRLREKGDDPKEREAEEERLEREMERLEEQVEREVEALADRFEADFEKSFEKSLKESGLEKKIEEQAEQLAIDIQRQVEQGASAEAINQAVQKALKDANLDEQIRRIAEEARRLSEEAAAKVRALQKERQKEIERAKKQGRAGDRERRRLEQALQRDQQRLQIQLRQRQQALQQQLRRLNQALPAAPGVRSITVDFSPALAKIAEPTRDRVRAAMETAFSPPLIALPAPLAAPNPMPPPAGSACAPAPVPGTAPAPEAARMALAAPEVRFWSGRTAGEAGVTYAVPVERVRWALEQIREHGRVRHTYLGIKFDTLDKEQRERLRAPEEARLRVVEVVKGSPAEAAGLRPDDVILEVGGRKLDDAAEMVSRMARAKVGDQVSLTVWRDGARRTLQATLGERPQPRIQAWQLTPKVQSQPFIVTPKNDFGKSLRSFVRVGPSGRVAASASGTGRSAKITLEAQDAELESVLRELSRAAGLQFRAEGEAARRRVTLKIESVSVDDLVESLNRLYHLRADRSGGQITFRDR